MTPSHYFAYGSNMDPARVVDRRIRFTQISSAVLADYVLRFNKRSRDQKGAGHANIIVELEVYNDYETIPTFHTQFS
jgi:hypothetical protein